MKTKNICFRNVPQSCSSSRQSLLPSHLAVKSIHFPFLQTYCCAPQGPSKGNKTNFMFSNGSQEKRCRKQTVAYTATVLLVQIYTHLKDINVFKLSQQFFTLQVIYCLNNILNAYNSMHASLLLNSSVCIVVNFYQDITITRRLFQSPARY